MANMKPGGGGKLQPYVPAGNGDESGEYTDKEFLPITNLGNCLFRNVKGKFNFAKSILVKTVKRIRWTNKHDSLLTTSTANTVIKKLSKDGYVLTERYYNSKGQAYLDIDYTNHKNPKAHPYVPHIHRWLLDKNGIVHRQQWEKFK